MRNNVIWLDDTRNPEKEMFQFRYGVDPKNDNVVWLKNYKEFTDYINKNGLPDKIYFDHDLGPGKDGYDAAKFLVDYCTENDLILPEYDSQSSNPVGKKNILKLLGNFACFQEQNK